MNSTPKMRLLATMDLIPTAPNTISVAELFDQLQSRGFDLGVHGVHRRTIQRDLNTIMAAPLSRKLNYQNDGNGLKKLWFWEAPTT